MFSPEEGRPHVWVFFLYKVYFWDLHVYKLYLNSNILNRTANKSGLKRPIEIYINSSNNGIKVTLRMNVNQNLNIVASNL